MSIDKAGKSGSRKKSALKGLGIMLFLIMMTLTGVVLYLWINNYQQLEKTQVMLEDALNKQSIQFEEIAASRMKWRNLLDKSEAELTLEVKQHAATKVLLTESAALLDSAKEENVRLADEIARLESVRDTQESLNQELENKIATLKHKNTEVEQEIVALNAKLEQYNTDIADLAEGRDVIHFFKEKIHEVKLGIHRIKRKTHLAKVEAQQERDRLEYLAGNNGFVKKDGEWTDPTPPEIDASMINIDVQFTQ